MRIELVFSPRAREVWEQLLELAPGTTVAQALKGLDSDAQWQQAAAAGFAGGYAVSLWSRHVGLDEVLRDGDRLELSRPLLVDPKVARRERFHGQGSKTAGLFSKRRPGAKAGY